MRSKLGESLSTVQKYNTPLEQATTSSLEALQAYNFGLNTDDDVAALAFCHEPVFITTTGTILAGFGRWRLALVEGRNWSKLRAPVKLLGCA